MIISMYKKICITNRHLTERGDSIGLLRQLKKVLTAEKLRPDMVILREKDLNREEYAGLAVKVLRLCRAADVLCCFNGYPDLAKELSADGAQLSFSTYMETSVDNFLPEEQIGVSVHSAEEAVAAADRGAGFLIFGHIFETDCKKGLPGRGLEVLAEVCRKTAAVADVPVYAIGGIDVNNAPCCIAAGAVGVCMMSGYMKPSFDFVFSL